MKKRFLVILFLMLLAFSVCVFSHEEEQEFDLAHSHVFPLSQLAAAGYGSLVFGILIFIILVFHKKMNEPTKKIVYLLVVIAVSVTTLYLIITTLQLNFISSTKGPVHWHADFEIWACGNEIKLAKPANMLSNKQGTNLLHSHQDNRIHVEGVLLDKKEASLGAFFHAIHGSLSSDGIKIPTDNGLESFHDGDKCNDKPAKLYVFINGKLISDSSSYVIAPYEKVPPGDRIKFVFTEKLVEEINPNLKQNGS